MVTVLHSKDLKMEILLREKFKDTRLLDLLPKDPTQMLWNLPTPLKIDGSTIGKRLALACNMNSPQSGKSSPTSIEGEDVEKRFVTREAMFRQQRRNGFLHPIVENGEKWISYGPEWFGAWTTRPSMSKCNIHCSKRSRCVSGAMRETSFIVSLLNHHWWSLLTSTNNKSSSKEKWPQRDSRCYKLTPLHDHPDRTSQNRSRNTRNEWNGIRSTFVGCCSFGFPPVPVHAVSPSGERFTCHESIYEWLDERIKPKELEFFYLLFVYYPKDGRKLLLPMEDILNVFT